MFTIHVFTPGQNVFEIYLKVQMRYPVSKVFILQEENAPENIQDSIKKVVKDCNLRSLPCKVLIFSASTLESEVQMIINIRKMHPDAQLYINITAGKKDFSIIAFMASVWVNGISYYWPSEQLEPLEFPVPRVSIKDLSDNKLHLKVMGLLFEKSMMTQSMIKNNIKNNPNNYSELSPQTLSQSIKYLKKYGLVNVEREGRSTNVSLTLSGRLAYSMIYSS